MNKNTLSKSSIAAALGFVSFSTATAGLIAYYPFDDTVGDTAAATFGKDANWANPGNNLTWGGTSPLASGTSVDMNGTNTNNSHFAVDLNGTLISSEMTVSMWINPDSRSQTYEGLFMTRPANPGATTMNGGGNGNWGFAWDGTGIDARATGAIDTATDTIVADNTIAGNDGWYHIVWVWDGDGIADDSIDPTQTVYINGVLAESGSAVSDVLQGGIWHLGNDSCCNGRDFNGQVDDLGIWDQALTAQDAADLYNQVKSPADIDPPVDNDNDGLTNEYEDNYDNAFLDKDVADADNDADTEDGMVGSPAQPDGLTSLEEFAIGTEPNDADSDNDGLLDGEEAVPVGAITPGVARVINIVTDPLDDDSDDDGLLDGEEVSDANGFVTDPNSRDSDNDTVSDKDEIDNGTDPTDPNDPPAGPNPQIGLIALYKLDEEAGSTTAKDSATADGDQTSTQMTGVVNWSTDGLIGGAIELDGSSYLEVDDAIPASAPAFSISAWIKPSTQGAYRGVFSTRDLGATPNLNWGLNVEGNLQGDLRFANTNSSNGLDTPGVVVDEWNLLTMTYTSDGFFSTGKAYLNGAFVSDYTSDNGLMTDYQSRGTYLLGAEPNPNRAFIGLIDEVSVWSVALSDADISNLYRNGLAGIGLAGNSSQPFQITSMVYEANGDVTLTWNSSPGEQYSVLVNPTLTAPIQDWPDVEDGIASAGESTSYTVSAGDIGNAPKQFFSIRRN